MNDGQKLEHLRKMRGQTTSLRSQISRMQRRLKKAQLAREAALAGSSSLAKLAARADVELKRLFGKKGNVEHVLEAITTPRGEGGMDDMETLCIATSAANVRLKRATSRRYPRAVIEMWSAASKCGGSKSAKKLLRGPGLVGLKLKKGQVAARSDTKYNLSCVPSQNSIRNDDEKRRGARRSARLRRSAARA